MSNGRIKIVTDWVLNEWEVLKAEAANIEDRTVSPPYPLKHVLRIKLDLPKNADSPQLSSGELYVDIMVHKNEIMKIIRNKYIPVPIQGNQPFLVFSSRTMQRLMKDN